jgi:flagellar protein FliO/FliZ
VSFGVSAQSARATGGGAAGVSEQQTSRVEGAAASPVDERELGLDDAVVSPNAAADPSSLAAILRTVLALAVTAAAVYGVVYLLKRVTRQHDAVDPHLKVLASAHLGSNRYVHVVSLGSKAWLVGASDGGVDLIAEVEDQETRDALFLEESRRQTEKPGALSLDFKAMMRKLGGGQGYGAGPGADSIRKKRERLRGL